MKKSRFPPGVANHTTFRVRDSIEHISELHEVGKASPEVSSLRISNDLPDAPAYG